MTLQGPCPGMEQLHTCLGPGYIDASLAWLWAKSFLIGVFHISNVLRVCESVPWPSVLLFNTHMFSWHSPLLIPASERVFRFFFLFHYSEQLHQEHPCMKLCVINASEKYTQELHCQGSGLFVDLPHFSPRRLLYFTFSLREVGDSVFSHTPLNFLSLCSQQHTE